MIIYNNNSDSSNSSDSIDSIEIIDSSESNDSSDSSNSSESSDSSRVGGLILQFFSALGIHWVPRCFRCSLMYNYYFFLC